MELILQFPYGTPVQSVWICINHPCPPRGATKVTVTNTNGGLAQPFQFTLFYFEDTGLRDPPHPPSASLKREDEPRWWPWLCACL
jgi:hypothetical protein